MKKEQANKLMKDIELMESMDNMFTAALEALEAYEFVTAFTLATIVQEESFSIEQKCAAMMIKQIASKSNEKETDKFLETIYNI